MQQAEVEFSSQDLLEVKLYDDLGCESFEDTDGVAIEERPRLMKVKGSQDEGWQLVDDEEYEEPVDLEFYQDFNDVLKQALKSLPVVRRFEVYVNDVFVYEGSLPHFKLCS